MNKPMLAFYAAVAIACAAIDQWIKWLVVAEMDLLERIDLVPVFSLYHTRNTGIAFSFLSGFNDTVMLALTIAVFNLADAFITVGAGLVILQELLDWRGGSRRQSDDQPPADG